MKTVSALARFAWLLPILLWSAPTFVLPLSGGQTFESNLERTFAVQPGGRFILDADRGSVRIEPATQSEVSVEVKRSITGLNEAKAQEIFDAHTVIFQQDGERVTVAAKLDESKQKLLRRGANFQVRYLIRLPKRFDLDLKTSAGEILSGDIEGTVKARTAGGSLKFDQVTGAFEGTTAAGSIDLKKGGDRILARTSGGSITVGEAQAESELVTSAGSIKIQKARGRLLARTSGGNIEAGTLEAAAKLQTSAGSIKAVSIQGPLEAATSGGSIHLGDLQNIFTATTSAGSIDATISAQPTAECRLTTSGGSITVKIDAELGFDLDAKASGGRVTTELPVTMTVVGEHRSEGLRGKLNGGGPGLVLKTSAGSVTIRRK